MDATDEREAFIREAFIAAIELHTPALLRVTASLVGIQHAPDAAQEAVLRGWQARATLRDPSALRSWLLRIAVNVCREWQRGRFGQHERHDQLLDEGADALLATIETDPGGPGRVVLLDLREAINRLDADLRLPLVLAYFGGTKWSPMTPPDTSSIHWSQDTVSAEVFADETGAAYLSITTEDDSLPSAQRQYQTVVYHYVAGHWRGESLPVPHMVLVGFSSDGNGGTWAVGWTENPYAAYVLYTQGDGMWHIYGHS